MDSLEKPPTAAERKEPIVTSWRAMVRHLPQYPNTRYTSLETKCGKHGWFWSPSRYGGLVMPELPMCRKCLRRG
jgi:hypothetical protein